MPLLQALVLGAVQGLTEFIPISSSGHLVLVPDVLGWEHPGLAFDVLLHVASLVALLVYFRADLFALGAGVLRGDAGQRRLAGLLALGTVPAAAAGVLLGDFFEDSFEDARSAAIQLVITALILVGGELALRRHRSKVGGPGARTEGKADEDLRSTSDLGAVDAGVIGVAQAISILPGISRSGATITAGLVLGVGRAEAARFSFLLAVPALLGAALVEVPELAGGETGGAALAAGFLASLVTSYAAIAGLIRYLKTNTLYPFAAYCVIAGLLFYVLL